MTPIDRLVDGYITIYVKIVKVFGHSAVAFAPALTLPVLSAIIAPHDTQLIPLIRFISALKSIRSYRSMLE